MKKVLLDTNGYSRLLKGDEKVLTEISAAEQVYMSIFVIGELLSGFKVGSKELENKSILSRFIQKSTVILLNTSFETAEIFAKIKQELKQAGTPLPINDIWIAAQTIETGSVLITYDKHFQKIRGLLLWDYM